MSTGRREWHPERCYGDQILKPVRPGLRRLVRWRRPLIQAPGDVTKRRGHWMLILDTNFVRRSDPPKEVPV